MYCQKCGNQIQDGATTCPQCSAVVTAPNPAAMAADRVKAASRDAVKALKLFVTNPVAGLSVAFDALGETRALAAGIVFGVTCSLLVVLASYRLLPEWGRPHGFTGLLKILIAATVPVVSLFGATLLARKSFGGKGSVGHDSFISGAASLPFGIVAILGAVLGLGNIEVISLFAIFALCTTILMLFAGLTRINKTSERAATLAVPLMLVATAWLSKIIYAALLKEL